MNTEHTPGPWNWIGTKKHPESFCYLQNADYENVGISLEGFTICPANARLIAAAPDLLEALQKIAAIGDGEAANLHKHQVQRYSRGAIEIARAAIAKVR